MNYKKFILLFCCTFYFFVPINVMASETCTYSNSDGQSMVIKINDDGIPDGKFGGFPVVFAGVLGGDKWSNCPDKISIYIADYAIISKGETSMKNYVLNLKHSENNNSSSTNQNNNSANTNQNNNSYTYNASDWNLCTNPNALKVFRFIGNILRVAFIAIPIILIVMGSIDFMKAVIANKDDDMKKAQTTFIKRCLAAIIVFLVPLITSIVLNILNEGKTNCLTCVLNPNSCNISK